MTGFVDFSQVSWYRRQKKLHETDRLLFQTKGSRQTLYIRKVNPTDFGNYSCRAENALGEARTFTELSGLFFQKDRGRPQTSFIIAIFKAKHGRNYKFAQTISQACFPWNSLHTIS